MVADTSTNNNMNIREDAHEQYPEVPEEAIVKPEDERPMRMSKRPGEELLEDGDKPDIEKGGENSSDIDEDGSPDWDPAIGPGI
jgi:hypothetical protein